MDRTHGLQVRDAGSNPALVHFHSSCTCLDHKQLKNLYFYGEKIQTNKKFGIDEKKVSQKKLSSHRNYSASEMQMAS